MGAFDDLDRLKIASSEFSAAGFADNAGDNAYLGKVHYNSFITKANWQFAPSWNLMVKGMYETASVSKIEKLKDYRKSYGYQGRRIKLRCPPKVLTGTLHPSQPSIFSG